MKRRKKGQKKENIGTNAQSTDTIYVKTLADIEKLKIIYPNDDQEDEVYPDDGYCPHRYCRNPDGSKVKLFDFGSYLVCGHCYRKYEK